MKTTSCIANEQSIVFPSAVQPLFQRRSKTLFALIDANNFFVSCERVFQPGLLNKPVVVLSNNDGCAISRSHEAKRLGIPMGAPLHTFSHMIKPHDISVLSSNFELYGDLSHRMMKILQTFSPDVDVYSIDEAFVDLAQLPLQDWNVLAKHMYNAVLQQIGIPITIGIAPTKTLAKVAGHLAKERQAIYEVLDNSEKAVMALDNTAIGDVWGIGRALAPKLRSQGIYTALDLAKKDTKWARKYMTISGERLVLELQGVSCLLSHEQDDSKKSIQVARSFGKRLTDFADMAEAISTYATRLGEQLRKHKLVTSALHVYCRTSPFGNDGHYKGAAVVGFERLTNDTPTLIKGAIEGLRKSFKAGFRYQKAGLHAMGLMAEGASQQLCLKPKEPNVLFVKGAKRTIGSIVDGINKRHGRDAIFWASSGIQSQFMGRNKLRSARYTTCWGEIAHVQA